MYMIYSMHHSFLYNAGTFVIVSEHDLQALCLLKCPSKQEEYLARTRHDETLYSMACNSHRRWGCESYKTLELYPYHLIYNRNNHVVWISLTLEGAHNMDGYQCALFFLSTPHRKTRFASSIYIYMQICHPPAIPNSGGLCISVCLCLNLRQSSRARASNTGQ